MANFWRTIPRILTPWSRLQAYQGSYNAMVSFYNVREREKIFRNEMIRKQNMLSIYCSYLNLFKHTKNVNSQGFGIYENQIYNILLNIHKCKMRSTWISMYI